MKVVNKNISVRIYPSKADKNDNGEKIANINIIESQSPSSLRRGGSRNHK